MLNQKSTNVLKEQVRCYLDNLYKTISYLISPFLRAYFYSRCLYGKDHWSDVQNHFGKPNKKRPEGELIWIHAASIGESTSALTYIKHLKKQNKELNVLLTTITVTSAQILESKLKNIEGCIHQFVVADNPFWVRRFLDYWKPSRAFFLESEIWPNIMDELYKRKIPAFLLNARLSERSYKRWKHFENFFSSILKKFTAILAQSELDAQRYGDFAGANVFKIDNLKYANDPLPCNQEIFSVLKQKYANKKILVAASTHAGEEEEILKAHIELKKEFDLITIIIPRHLTRINEVTKLFKDYNVSYVLRSNLIQQQNTKFRDLSGIKLSDNNLSNNDQTVSNLPKILCVDVFGEVGTYFRLANITFVGGSLVPIGGHNIYEPIALKKPVLFGPHMENALEVRDLILSNEIGFEVKSYIDIVDYCRKFFTNKDLTNQVQERILGVTHNESLLQIDQIVEKSIDI